MKFLVAPEIRDIEKTLAANDRPVAVGIPGYILPMDMDARLFLKYRPGRQVGERGTRRRDRGDKRIPQPNTAGRITPCAASNGAVRG